MLQLPENALLKNGKYHIVRMLGQGGYGITYLATTLKEVKGEMGSFPVRVPVAIKEFFVRTYCIRDALTSEVVVPTAEGKEQVPRLMEDFVREANSMAEMSHPNIVRVIDVFEDNKTMYYVMQYLEGCSLAEKVNKEGPLPNELAHRYIFQIAGAVSYIHDRNVCHYDIKPANIMLPDDDRAVLIDFGISRHYDQTGNSTTVRPVGYSSGFSSPEQVRGDIEKFSPSSDVYSLAATLYFMLTGKTPPGRIDGYECQPEECPKNVSHELWEAVMSGMKADKSLRPQTVKAWLYSIEDNTSTKPQAKNDQEKANRLPDPELAYVKDKKKEDDKKHREADGQPQKGGKNGTKRISKVVVISLICIVALTAVLWMISNIRNDNVAPPKAKEIQVTDMPWNQRNRYGNTYLYTGPTTDSIPNGYGHAVYSDGSSYEGMFNNGLRDGNDAVFIDSDGNKFNGSFSHDSIVIGRITAPDGRFYEGSFQDDCPYDGSWFDADGNKIYKVDKGCLIEIP